MIKGEWAEAVGPKGTRKHRQMRRIEEYEKFMNNCRIVKERLDVERARREKERVRRRNTVIEGMRTSPEYSLLIRAKSLTYLDVVQTSNDHCSPNKTDQRFSMPPLVDCNSNLDLEDKILLWQSCAGPFTQRTWTRARTCSMREIPDTSQHLTVRDERARRSTSLK